MFGGERFSHPVVAAMPANNLRFSIPPVSTQAAHAAREHIDALTKPLGSLGRIEELGVQLAAIAGGIPTHNYKIRTIIVGAGDHGVAEEGVSAYPPEVTTQMISGFLSGHAAINAFAHTVRAELYVVDFGVREPTAPHPRLFDVHVARGTANLARGPAMLPEGPQRALAAGITVFEKCMRRTPFDVLALGEMGIGNTTSASAIICAFTGQPPSAIVGRGTGVNDERLARKIAITEQALARIRDFSWEEIAAEVGGYEIVGLAGVLLAAARARIPIVLDGFIVAASALIAQAIAPQAMGYCIAAHRSQEPGHAYALQALGLRPLLDFAFCLGEGSGAALALPLLEAAARMMREMKTFAQAGVAVKEEEEAPPIVAA
jgi:nicotinate-nucleotide--dimethylbenzimidazole phosphoribosyltransferase